MVQHPATAALRAALHAAERYEYEPVMQYLKSPLSPLTREAADRLEQYAYRWNLHGSAWEQPLQFHPGGYGAPWTEDDRAALAQLELWRAAAIAPVQTLRGALRRAGCLAESVEAVAQFLTQTGLAETLAGQAEQLHAAGQTQQAQQTEQLYEYLLQALEQIWQIAGRQSMPQEQFLQLLELLVKLEKAQRDDFCQLLLQWRALLVQALQAQSGIDTPLAQSREIARRRTMAELSQAIAQLSKAAEACQANVGVGHLCGMLAATLL